MMALSSDTLTAMILTYYRAELRDAFPNVVKSVSIEEVPKEDGSVEFKKVEERGPAELDEEQVRPLAKAIARAMVDHIEAAGEVPDTAAGQNWRVT